MRDSKIVDLNRQRTPPKRKLARLGVGRVADNEQAVLVIFSRKLTDEELRFFDDVCGRTAPLMEGEAT